MSVSVKYAFASGSRAPPPRAPRPPTVFDFAIALLALARLSETSRPRTRAAPGWERPAGSFTVPLFEVTARLFNQQPPVG